MSEHGVPIGPGPWQPTPGFFGSLLGAESRAGKDTRDLGVLGLRAETFPVLENFELAEELGQLAGLEQVVGIARTGVERALMNGEGFVDQQASRYEHAQDRGNQRAMQVAKHQNRTTAVTSQRNLGWILEVCADRFDRQCSLRGGAAKRVERRAVAVDSDHPDAGFGRSDRVSAQAAGEIDHRAEPGRGANPLELLAEERGRR